MWRQRNEERERKRWAAASCLASPRGAPYFLARATANFAKSDRVVAASRLAQLYDVTAIKSSCYAGIWYEWRYRPTSASKNGYGSSGAAGSNLLRLTSGYKCSDRWPLATDTDFAAADRAFEKCQPLPVVIDNALSTEALEELQRFSRDATIWFEVKDHGGHLGAYFEEGLACELLIAAADALRRALPRNLEGLRRAQLWAYKHVQGGKRYRSACRHGVRLAPTSGSRRIKLRSILKLRHRDLAGSNARGLGFQSCQR